MKQVLVLTASPTLGMGTFTARTLPAVGPGPLLPHRDDTSSGDWGEYPSSFEFTQ